MGPTSKSFISPYSRTLSFTFVVVVVLFLLLPFQIQSDHSIYDHLRTNGLPIGLLPKGITDYSLDPTSGRFQINLTRPCNAKFESQLHYDFNVSGLLSYGKMGNLSGISQQELFLWFPVKCIRVDVPSSGLIYFDVGVVDKQFSLSLFENPRDCHEVDPPPSVHLRMNPNRLSLKYCEEMLCMLFYRLGKADILLKIYLSNPLAFPLWLKRLFGGVV